MKLTIIAVVDVPEHSSWIDPDEASVYASHALDEALRDGEGARVGETLFCQVEPGITKAARRAGADV